jgi:hypothetical protein
LPGAGLSSRSTPGRRMMVFAGGAFQCIRRSLRADDAHLHSH